jgi:plasmid stability protein
MRTTVTIPDALYRELKVRAGSSGRTVSDLIEDALRQSLVAATEQGPLPELPVFNGRAGLRPGVDLDDNAGLRQIMDERPPTDARR